MKKGTIRKVGIFLAALMVLSVFAGSAAAWHGKQKANYDDHSVTIENTQAAQNNANVVQDASATASADAINAPQTNKQKAAFAKQESEQEQEAESEDNEVEAETEDNTQVAVVVQGIKQEQKNYNKVDYDWNDQKKKWNDRR